MAPVWSARSALAAGEGGRATPPFALPGTARPAAWPPHPARFGAALTALHRPEQLNSHLRLALANGLGKDELVAAITHLAFYSGWPNAMSAMTQLKAITGERGGHRL
ncbi:carboxymuconolactone decarboxylase family protein [Streptomyces diastatochromogenes]|uniref:carboxymuconolactone decarboxylase family protein n=1 Tax=Streptomyces diastatochromogenes TaxID=42236 RepID=UPI000B91C0DF|nr:carboxymuconolactone decarboxylase family protein [Streptomyces diastatochromogenes]